MQQPMMHQNPAGKKKMILKDAPLRHTSLSTTEGLQCGPLYSRREVDVKLRLERLFL